ncbi:Nitroreductase [Lentzea albidocapillata subsp. violacea]|uniref:Nitroreductase n=1 Tax=Lentzea albidocapillata subsp. violacea TaxID=128104 RepID=A0A1G9J0N4_9PSEU|nr:nitroreductase family protein [Lentzea albidocapillata]SDL31039.1 Nitroreductase [Lentzea albidocapillata subsp. violacea]
MEFQDVVRRRRMVRRFTDEPVSEESLQRIMRNAVRGPSAGFSQGQGFLVLRGEQLRRLTEMFEWWSGEDAKTAPVVVIPFSAKEVYLERYAEADKDWTGLADEDRWPVPYWDIDTGMAALLILQTAVDEGLGAVFFGTDKETWPELRAAFGVPDRYVPIGMIAIGHSAEESVSEGASPLRRKRKLFDEVVHWGQWQ